MRPRKDLRRLFVDPSTPEAWWHYALIASGWALVALVVLVPDLRLLTLAVLLEAIWLFMLWRNLGESEEDLQTFFTTVAALLSLAVMSLLWFMLS